MEKELGFSGKQDIEAYGVAEFNAKCRESVLRHVDAFEEMTERMGYWVDTDRPLPHDGADLRRVGVVGAQADPRQGPAGRGLPRLAVLPPLRHRAVRPRARPGLRDRHRPERLRPVPADVRSVRRARPRCSSGRRRRGPWCPTPPSPRTPTSTTSSRPTARRRWCVAEPLFGEVLGEGWTVRDTVAGTDDGALDLPAPVRARRVPAGRARRPVRGAAHRGAGRLRHDRGRHRAGAPVPRVRRGRHGGLQAPTACRSSYPSSRTATSRTTCRWSAGSSSSTPTPTS